MTDPQYAHYIEVLDRSGSMADPSEPGSVTSKADVATKGVNDFNNAQLALPGKSTFTLWQFDTQKIEKLTDFTDSPTWTCHPRLGTPLRDALATAIVDGGEALAKLPENVRPGRVFVIVATDGLENASKEYSAEALRALVKQQTEDYNWEFIYIGADIDAFAEGARMNINTASTLGTNTAHPGAMAASYGVLASAVTRGRAGGQSVSFTTEERQVAEKGTTKGA